MAIRDILLLGNENLYRICGEVREEDAAKAARIIQDLHDTMLEFRRKYGFGRAIAAPQIDEPYRILYMNFEGNSIAFINPVIGFPDDERFEMWDDCMSFPGLEVRLKRYRKCKVQYRDQEWKLSTVDFEGDLAELFQHEYDHLDGILAVQKAVDNKALRINRSKSGCF